MSNLSIEKVIFFAEKGLLVIVALATLFASLVEVKFMWDSSTVTLADLLLLFIYTEVLGMVGAFYKSSKIPITLPLFIAMTALSRLIILKGSGSEPTNILFEAGAILLIAVACLVIRFRPNEKTWDD
ncbi:MAG: phosphate-starvation-inducible PsiE family protein [Alphaproteobacteria bacterium]|jgi:protein PsiE|nr:phosphate-starvation-inducible PsiE family protein [Alphaproteobacteria bacterium]MBT5729084.1 phosphate-starvation-inducible PsiE family protein [Alphaproteobacteria bacterium]MBT7220232.1 phosphate-starvation-inducible PsiE family protein [Alphaproteobacteria bacterium]MDA7776428.1 phosphate-starvation-inducible PsiE family protein [Alphaproteobacteria bacterium]MDA8882000.1 phosphate-starvation-inducible PsiE family protein [Alphaproteobacteria bacterium]|tara:strand:+ start:1405 stop:1785 length:381 start_codon:yes stop_codon:yes gene_type:complete